MGCLPSHCGVRLPKYALKGTADISGSAFLCQQDELPVKAQQKVLASAGQNGQPASAVPIATQGWIYLGKVDTSHGNWVDPPKPATTLASPKLTAGETITLSKDVSLHDNKAPGQTSFNQAAVLAAVPGGSTATVVGFDYSKALGGGDFLWARVVVSATH